jgi:signal transduction histidine kinase
MNKDDSKMTPREDVAKKRAEPVRREPVSSSAAAMPAREALAGMSGIMMESIAADALLDSAADKDAASTVQIRIEPFAPLIVPDGQDAETVFPGQIFLVRHVQIENTHMLQGFRLNETELAEQVQESARRLARAGMGVELGQAERPEAVHTAILDFGFGELVLNLLEQDPGWIAARVARLNRWMAAILAVVWLAVLLAMLALWRNLNEQVKLARKKDDFLSAVSHELRTPLTSIRMYTEMLEKDWVKDDAKRREYYGTMRQESERLTRLIENVLDFSRIQRGKKHFEFTIGDVNGSIRDVVEMMRPCAERAGFVIETELAPMEPFAFDRDAVMQIVINLIDNALKYAREASDKRIIVRTHPEKGCAVIEVEDHGPGVPKSQQKKIFEAFYRCGDESTRQTTGTGLGLALVKRFAEAHRGVVEILNAKPAGALFRVRIAR